MASQPGLRGRLSALAAVLAIGCWLAAVPARAADPAADRARAHFEKGTALYNLARFKDALAEFEAGYLEKPDPIFLYNIGQCHRQAGNLPEALRFYRTYLRNAPRAPNRADVERRIRELETALAGQETLRTAPPREPLPPSAAAPEPAPAEPAVPAPPLQAPPPPAPVAVAVAAPDSPPPAAPPLYTRWWLWTAIGAAVVTGVVLGVALSGGGDPACPAGFTCRGGR